ncbi:hypothetical protein CRYUN_Cryun12cG0009400 [Craigia yunnanensis]
MKSTFAKTADDVRNSNGWVVVKSWNPCPLGMLPRALGSSGRIPVVDYDNDCQKDTELVKGKNNRERGKREASDDIQLLNFSSPKKVKETVENYESGGEDVSSPGTCGHLKMDGLWKKVGETELQAIAYAVKNFGLETAWCCPVIYSIVFMTVAKSSCHPFLSIYSSFIYLFSVVLSNPLHKTLLVANLRASLAVFRSPGRLH